jgi:hypothetical protein
MLSQESGVGAGGPSHWANRQQQHKNFENFQEAHHPVWLDMAGNKLTQTLLWILGLNFFRWIFSQFNVFAHFLIAVKSLGTDI